MPVTDIFVLMEGKTVTSGAVQTEVGYLDGTQVPKLPVECC